ncbi:MAG TPA: 2TM domain-containing protein, partial [Gemmatimonadaceae bacterium]|nr:2TM domain-containing protein [Gemmatimonadaceae bacterium]
RARRADVAEDLETIVMRLLEKDPADRFPDGAALVAALDGAPLAPLRRRPPTHSIGEVVDDATSSAHVRSRGVPPDVAERVLAHTRNARELRDERRRAKRGDKLSAIDRVKKTRARMASYLGTSLFLFGINYVTGDGFWWCLFPIFGIGLGVARDIGRLWADGVPLRALVSSKALRDLSALPAVGAAQAPALGTPQSAALPPGVSDDTLNGPFGAVLRQGIADHKTITDLESRLSEAERKLLPDVQATADSLFQRLVLLSGGLHRLDQQLGTARLPDLDQRIAQLEAQTADPVRSRPLALLKRQRDMLADLTTSRARLLEQFESAGLLLQNLSLDMLKVRSSGLDSALSGITSATQEVRALSREIGYALDAAAEVKEMERKGTV